MMGHTLVAVHFIVRSIVCSLAFSQVPESVVIQLCEEGMVFNCAGGLMVEHPLVHPYVVRINGTLDSVMGLSKSLVNRLLQQLAAVTIAGSTAKHT